MHTKQLAVSVCEEQTNTFREDAVKGTFKEMTSGCKTRTSQNQNLLNLLSADDTDFVLYSMIKFEKQKC